MWEDNTAPPYTAPSTPVVLIICLKSSLSSEELMCFTLSAHQSTAEGLQLDALSHGPFGTKRRQVHEDENLAIFLGTVLISAS